MRTIMSYIACLGVLSLLFIKKFRNAPSYYFFFSIINHSRLRTSNSLFKQLTQMKNTTKENNDRTLSDILWCHKNLAFSPYYN